IELLRQRHRALHVGEQHRHLLALPFERRPRLQDFVGQMFGSVDDGAIRISKFEIRTATVLQRAAARVAVLLPNGILRAAGGARSPRAPRPRALATEACVLGIRVAATWALHESCFLCRRPYCRTLR